MSAPARHLGVWTGVGIVIANMIGSGVFLSAGFMAQDMGPGTLLLAWVAGTVLALAGTVTYAAASRLVPRSGGEYRYISDLLHPSLGYLAGWATLMVGFSAPIAVNAVAAAGFLNTLIPLPSIVGVAAVLTVVITLLHAFDLDLSRRSQNALVLVKLLLVLGFVALGLVAGRHEWPTWTPPHVTPGFPVAAFAGSLFFIAYAFSGWNAAIYTSEEFKDPVRDVPRAMAIGCGLVAVLYLLVNWIFVANLTPERAAAVFHYDESRITLGHLVTQDLIGPRGASIMSAFAVIAFLSTMSAMIFAGPRVCTAMAEDGFLPRALIGRAGRPPVLSVLLQGALSLLLLFTTGWQQMLQNVGAILTLFSALVAVSLFWVRFARPELPRPSASSLAAAAVFIASAAWMLYFGIKGSTLLWLLLVAAAALVAYALSGRRGTAAPKS